MIATRRGARLPLNLPVWEADALDLEGWFAARVRLQRDEMTKRNENLPRGHEVLEGG